MFSAARQASGAGSAPAACCTAIEIETMTVDLARLARAAVIVGERVCDEPSLVEEIAEADADTLQDLLRKIDEIARVLRFVCRPQ